VEIDRPLDLLAVWHGKYEAWILKEAKVKTGPIGKLHRAPQSGNRRKDFPTLRLSVGDRDALQFS